MPRPERERQEAVLAILRGMSGQDAGQNVKGLKDLFWRELNYQHVSVPLSRRGWTDAASGALADDPLLFASAGDGGDFQIIYARLASDKLLRGPERQVVSRMLRQHPYALFVFSNSGQDRWHFLNVKYDDKSEKRRLFRRITIGPDERLRTASERIAMLDVESVGRDLFGLSPLALQQRHDEAFNVEAVTEKFFQDYKVVFSELQHDLARQTKDPRWAHDYALQFLNRLMFLYFIQRKRWLGEDTEFLRMFWQAYKDSGQQNDSFFKGWLSILFFEAFNNRFHGGHRQFPGGIQRILALAPYLNGGLFAQNDLDRKLEFTVTDARFDRVFTFMEKYNFTIAEDSPLDQEVAVDPVMLGHVYEMLVNLSEEAEEQGDAGIFYTGRIEIDLMCRLALVDYLSNHIGAKHKNVLYELVFALELDEKVAADKRLAQIGLWPDVDALVSHITVLDPASGSCSFLVGMLHVLDDLQERGGRQLGRTETAYERKKRIIGQSLYGVDVMDWACRVGELRLWLALIIDAQFTPAELHARQRPLLPNFTFKIRPGDSLVQEVGGIDMSHPHGSGDINATRKAKIARLKRAKVAFYEGCPLPEFRTEAALRNEETVIFRQILRDREAALTKKRNDLLRAATLTQKNLMGETDAKETQRLAQLEAQAKDLDEQIEHAKVAQKAICTDKPLPFVWDISFVEIFADDRDRFDIVVGNPPYVRQENISDPRLRRDHVTTENKKEYKAKLAYSVYRAFPRFFGYSATRDTVTHKLDAKSDLYIYFYFRGLSLLNPNGSFCFITSNSWLDVGYGADLQEFLLKHSHVKMVLDNKVKRSFKTAEVNTIIVLLSAPDDTSQGGRDQIARFVMFNVPFEHVLSPVVFEEIEGARERKISPEYRVCPSEQEELLTEGCEFEDGEAKGRGPLIKTACYVGSKWGGKYLRAPDIYWTILENGRGKLLPLGDFAEVKRGFTTGANEFFYLDEDRISEWGIEQRFLAWHLDSPRGCYSIPVGHSVCTKLFVCNDPLPDLKGTGALKYIKWGESQGYQRRSTCKSRNCWYSVGERPIPLAAWPRTFFERHICYEMPARTFCSDRFYGLSGDDLNPTVMACLNSTYASLCVEVNGYHVNHGGIDTSVWWLKTMAVLTCRDAELEDIYAKIRKRNIELARVELSMEGRRELDERIFQIIGAPLSALNDLYAIVSRMVADRIHKAGRELTQTGNP